MYILFARTTILSIAHACSVLPSEKSKTSLVFQSKYREISGGRERRHAVGTCAGVSKTFSSFPSSTRNTKQIIYSQERKIKFNSKINSVPLYHQYINSYRSKTVGPCSETYF